MLIGAVLVMLHKFPSESESCNKTGVCGMSTISVPKRDTKSLAVELVLGRNEDI